jgi:hypothetical protein
MTLWLKGWVRESGQLEESYIKGMAVFHQGYGRVGGSPFVALLGC